MFDHLVKFCEVDQAKKFSVPPPIPLLKKLNISGNREKELDG